MNFENLEEKIATELLDIGAITFNFSNPYKWASGWLSPVYCDNRLTLGYPKIRNTIKEGLIYLLKTNFLKQGANAIAGVATAGIPQGILVADALQIPFGYVRSKPKDHGRESQIEGKFENNAKIVVIEDLVSTGQSSLNAVSVLKNAGYDVLGVLAIFSYEFEDAFTSFSNEKIPFYYLCNFNSLLNVAIKKDYITTSQLTFLQRWHKNPQNWLSDLSFIQRY